MKDQSENLKRVIMSISDSFKEENHKCAIDNNLYKKFDEIGRW
jgi:hypothetical protein